MQKTTLSTPTRPRPGGRISLPSEAQAVLRMIGTAVFALADDGTADPQGLKSKLATLPATHRVTQSEPELLTIDEACDRLRLSRWGLYELMHRGELASVKIGRRRFIPAADANRFIAQLIDTGGQR